mgnify:FL=1
MNAQPRGRVSWNPATNVLTIVTYAKRGTKTKEHKELYDVERFETADPRVARFAYKLTKHSDGNIYEIGLRDFGPECSCPHHTFHPNGGPCKHGRALLAVGLI